MALGGPDSLDDVASYLLDLRGGRPTSPELVEEIRERYRATGGKSPVLEITRALAAKVEARCPVRVFVGLRHWHPSSPKPGPTSWIRQMRIGIWCAAVLRQDRGKYMEKLATPAPRRGERSRYRREVVGHPPGLVGGLADASRILAALPGRREQTAVCHRPQSPGAILARDPIPTMAATLGDAVSPSGGGSDAFAIRAGADRRSRGSGPRESTLDGLPPPACGGRERRRSCRITSKRLYESHRFRARAENSLRLERMAMINDPTSSTTAGGASRRAPRHD